MDGSVWTWEEISLRENESASYAWKEDTISYDELEFYLDVRRKEILAHKKWDKLSEREKPPLYRDLDHYFEDQDSMMV